jgi:hypothetical protein
MDNSHFDTLVRTLATRRLTRVQTRRGLAAAAIAGLTGRGLFAEEVGAKKNKARKKKVCVCTATSCTTRKVKDPKKVLRQNAPCAYKGGCTSFNPCATETVTPGVPPPPAVPPPPPVTVPVCDATSCPTGCCNGTTCETGTATTACGSGGATCQVCRGTTPTQVCGNLFDGTPGGGVTACCFPGGTPGVCNGDNYEQVCCAGPIGQVGCNIPTGTCVNN